MARKKKAGERLTEFFRRMLTIRFFEERMEGLFSSGRVPGTFHSSAGQEAVAVGVVSALGSDDLVVSNHRGHGHAIAKGADIYRLAAEVLGRADGYCRGRGGTQHFSIPDIGFLGTNGITGGGIPLATGVALALKRRAEKRVVACFFGDGAANQGTFHESLNMAGLWRLPILYVCENNCFAMGTRTECAAACVEFHKRAEAYCIENAVVDGNDVDAVLEAAEKAAGVVRSGKPFLLECRTYRLKGHSKSDQAPYRPQEELEKRLELCPLRRAKSRLLKSGVGEAELSGIEEQAAALIENAVEKALEAAEPTLDEAKEELAFASPVGSDAQPLPAEDESAPVLTYRQALNLALREEMDRDKHVVVIGEDVGVYNGAFKVTEGLLDKYGPERIIDTPISENSFTGVGVGAAVGGLRPVVEIMFMDFIALAADQIINHAAKLHYAYAGQVNIPLVIRTPAGGYRGYGATHSQTFDSLFMQIPGLKVYAPARPRDARGMLKAAIRDDDPVLFIEHKLLYGVRGPVPEEEEVLPAGKARVVRKGEHLTIISYGYALYLALKAADALRQKDVTAEVIDLRSLFPLDFETCVESASKTGRVMVVEEGVLFGGVGAEIASRLQEGAFGYLEAPVLRVGADRVPIPVARNLEDEVLPNVQDIVLGAKRLLEF